MLCSIYSETLCFFVFLCCCLKLSCTRWASKVHWGDQRDSCMFWIQVFAFFLLLPELYGYALCVYECVRLRWSVCTWDIASVWYGWHCVVVALTWRRARRTIHVGAHPCTHANACSTSTHIQLRIFMRSSKAMYRKRFSINTTTTNTYTDIHVQHTIIINSQMRILNARAAAAACVNGLNVFICIYMLICFSCLLSSIHS